jgi:hypothetical protein
MAEKQRQQNADDLNNEQAGRETGRMPRFLTADGSPAMQEEKRKDQDMLQYLLMTDPEYSKLYHESGTILRHTEISTDQALQKANLDWENASDALKDTLKNANKLPDGTAVFKDANGNVWTQNGRLVGSEEVQSIVWKQDSVSYEDYLRMKQYEEDLRLWLDKLRGYEADLGSWRERWSDTKTPITKDEMHEMQEDVKRIQHSIEEHDNHAIRSMTVPKLTEIPTHQGDMTMAAKLKI